MHWAGRESFGTEVHLCVGACASSCKSIPLCVCTYACPAVLMTPISTATLMAAYRVTGRQREIFPFIDVKVV